MRWVATSSIAAAVSMLVALPVAAEANSAQAVKLARIEAQGLAAAGDARLKSMISKATLQIGASGQDVQFTRKWVDAQPRATGSEQWRCLSEALYFEARGETVKGQFAVAEVIMNRVKSSRFPNTPCGVINQGEENRTCDHRRPRAQTDQRGNALPHNSSQATVVSRVQTHRAHRGAFVLPLHQRLEQFFWPADCGAAKSGLRYPVRVSRVQPHAKRSPSCLCASLRACRSNGWR